MCFFLLRGHLANPLNELSAGLSTNRGYKKTGTWPVGFALLSSQQSESFYLELIT
jgi:hypothetical protein